MSADLFAAFGVPQSKEEKGTPSVIAKSSPSPRDADPASLVDTQPWILQSQPIPKPQKQLKDQPLWKQDNRGADVLFDASDDEEDEDDFGDFEGATGQVVEHPASDSQHNLQTHTDLLGLDEFQDMQIAESIKMPPGSRYRQTDVDDLVAAESVVQDRSEQPKSHQQHQHYEDVWSQSDSAAPQGNYELFPHSSREGFASEDDEWGNFEDAETNTETPVQPKPTAKTGSSVTQVKTADLSFNEDEWEAFEDGPPVAQASANHSRIPLSEPESIPTLPASTSTPSQRPTNIPPPSTLLQLLPKVYSTLNQLSRQPEQPANLAQRTLQIYITTARIISGRQHRWKRDTLLSQSTRISQAGLKNTGMKLTVLDKSESIKEDQEAQEAIAAWQRCAAVLNAVMLRGKVNKPPMTLSTNMAVRGVGGLGVLNARECCAVCGLKRNERVTGIDISVDDTFGEFWAEHWGHKDCCEFWYQYEGLLDKR